MSSDIFKRKVVVITGASTGIGEQLAYQFAELKSNVVIASRNLEKLNQVAEVCRNEGAETLVVQTDVSDEAQCKNLIDATVKKFGSIDVLINNAGYGQGGKLEDFPDLQEFHKVIDVNFMGSVYCTFYALPYLKKSRGRIVAVSSVLGKVAAWGNTSYCGSKFAMAGFFDALRNELHGSGVSVTGIYPGYVVTEFAGNVVQPDGSTLGEKGRKIYSSKMMSAETCARLVIKATARRKREKVLTGLAKLGVLLNRISPKLTDIISLRLREIRDKRTQQAKES